MDPDGLRSWFVELAANPLLILAVFVIIRVMIYQHKENVRRFQDVVVALHESATASRTNADRIIAAIDRAGERVRVEATRRRLDDETR